MGSGASSASVQTQIAETSAEDLHKAVEAMQPETRARLVELMQEAEEQKPKIEGPPLIVPGISKEEAMPQRGVTAIAPPAGRPLSADSKKKPPRRDSEDVKVASKETPVVKTEDAKKEADVSRDKEIKPQTPAAEMEIKMTNADAEKTEETKREDDKQVESKPTNDVKGETLVDDNNKKDAERKQKRELEETENKQEEKQQDDTNEKEEKEAAAKTADSTIEDKITTKTAESKTEAAAIDEQTAVAEK